MNCPLCGETCRCHSELSPPASPGSGPDARATTDSVAVTVPGQQVAAAAERSDWRDEISARLSRYRSRRKIRPPHYPSLRLQFGAPESSDGDIPSATLSSGFAPVSDQALALDGMRQRPAAMAGEPPQEPSTYAAPQSASSPPGHSGAKILEFPRLTWGPAPPPLDQLAEPVVSWPRILEVPEVVPPPPALGGITMGAPLPEESGRQSGVDVPLQPGSLVRRFLAAVIDGLIVAASSALFGVIFWKVAAVRPPLVQMFSLAIGIPGLFWAAYQYLLVVYAARTPGLRLARLGLVRFEGTATNRSVRRWRVLASYLSGAALGMGFAWALLDEDSLCWHDRITRTYWAPAGRRPSGGSVPS